MTAEKVLAGLLEPGDVICVHHHHDSRCGECLAPWQTQAVITGRPAPVAGRLVVNWAAGTGPPGGRAAITGVSVFSPDEQVVRLDQHPPAGPGALTLMPCAGPGPGASDGARAGFIKARAFAARGDFEPVAHELGALDLGRDLGKLAVGDFPQPVDRLGVVR